MVQVGCVPRAAQTPLQPANELSAPTAAVRVTLVLTGKLTAQAVPQLMPAGLLVTVPRPSPMSATEISRGIAAKLALTSRSAVRVTVHDPVPLQAPPQPANVEPAAGEAVNVT